MMHRCTVACFEHEHRQGKGCACDTAATRAALGLHTADGGHTVNGGVSFPIEHEQDEPAYAWESVAPSVWCVLLLIIASLGVIVVGVASALGKYLPTLHI